MPELVDTHVHLDLPAFAPDRVNVIARAQAAGVTTYVVPAVDAGSWPGIQELCATHAGCFAAYGVHPLFVRDDSPADVDTLAPRLRNGHAVAVGEIGLDFHAAAPDPELQRRCFQAQLALARALDLPVIVHARQALEEVILTLRHVGGLRGVVHSFSGSPEQAARLWGLGFHLGIGGKVTYARAQRLQRIVAGMPKEFLLLESDAPDQPDADWRGRRNEPARVASIAQAIAALRGESLDDVAAFTTANARRLFALDAHR